MNSGRDGKKRGLLSQSNHGRDAKHDRNVKRYLEMAERQGPEQLENARTLVDTYASSDPEAQRDLYKKMFSAKSVGDSKFIEIAERDRSARVRGSNVRTANFEQRDRFVRQMYKDFDDDNPRAGREEKLLILREKILDHVKWAIIEGEPDDEEMARKLLSPDKRNDLKALSARVEDSSEEIDISGIISIETLRKITSKKKMANS